MGFQCRRLSFPLLLGLSAIERVNFLSIRDLPASANRRFLSTRSCQPRPSTLIGTRIPGLRPDLTPFGHEVGAPVTSSRHAETAANRRAGRKAGPHTLRPSPRPGRGPTPRGDHHRARISRVRRARSTTGPSLSRRTSGRIEKAGEAARAFFLVRRMYCPQVQAKWAHL